MDYAFTQENKNLNPIEIWNNLSFSLISGSKIKSIRNIEYTVEVVNEDKLELSAPSRKQGKTEEIEKHDFLIAIEELKKEKVFNTSPKGINFGSGIYMKRSLLFAILLAANVVERKLH